MRRPVFIVMIVLGCVLAASGCGGLTEEGAAPAVGSSTQQENPTQPKSSDVAIATTAPDTDTAIAVDPQAAVAATTPAPGIVPVPTSPYGKDVFSPISGSLQTVVDTLGKRLPSYLGLVEDGTTMNLRLAVPAVTPPHVNLGEWQGALLLGALLDQLSANGDKPGTTSELAPVTAVMIELEDPQGNRFESGGTGNAVREQRFAQEGEDAIRAQLTRGAEELGITIDDVQFVYVMQQSVAVFARTSGDVRPLVDRFQFGDAFDVLLGKNPGRFEGWYFELADSAGRGVYVRWFAGRAASSATWLTDDLFDLHTSHPPVTGEPK